MSNDIACRELVELITDYLEGALPSSVHEAIDAHLAQCDGCTRALDQVRETMRIAGELPADGLERLPASERDALLDAFTAWRDGALPG
jgi:anti-sigma factor RsiW